MQEIDQLVEDVADLVPLPAAYVRIRELVANPESSMHDIAEVITNDPALTARILRIANSAYLGLVSAVETIPRAVQVLGTRAVHDLALATSAMSTLNNIAAPAFDMYRFWRRSIYCAVTAQLIAEDIAPKEAQRLFVCGLLHDVGHLILAARAPDEFTAITTRAVVLQTPLPVLEKRTYGFDYAELGAALLRHWMLPESIHTPIAHHTEPSGNRAIEYARATAVLHCASVISQGSVWRDANDPPVPAFDLVAFSSARLDAARTEELMQRADEKVVEAMELLLPRGIKRTQSPELASAS